MKLNWGSAIAIFYGSFMAILLFFVIRSTYYDHSLVVENYYEADLHYQEHYEKRANGDALGSTLRIDYIGAEDRVNIRFPADSQFESGTVLFFKPADSDQDSRLSISSLEQQELSIATGHLSRGHWRLQLEWESGGKAYFRETEIYL